MIEGLDLQQPSPDVMADPKPTEGYNVATGCQPEYDSGWKQGDPVSPDTVISDAIRTLSPVIMDMSDSLNWIVNAAQELLFPISKYIGTKLKKTVNQVENLVSSPISAVRSALGENLIRVTTESNALKDALNETFDGRKVNKGPGVDPLYETLRVQPEKTVQVYGGTDSKDGPPLPTVDKESSCLCVSLSTETITAIRESVRPKQIVDAAGGILIGAVCGLTGADAWSGSDCQRKELEAYWAEQGDTRSVEQYLIQRAIFREAIGVA